jgi:diaminohydroxyphosphoribosylaminopyrimidine deaminase/5-amino-6-(5-phosphoribosylamino)uracil reductase
MAHQSDSYWISVASELSLSPTSVKRNPRVGSVIVDKSGLAIARGFHEGFGRSHAEQVAIANAGNKTKNATIFVSFAPCNHVGKTPSCCQQIIDCGITRVVYSQDDPNPVSMGNVEFLKSNGIEVLKVNVPNRFENINKRWLKSYQLNRPFVTAKMAISVDGKISDGTNKNIKLTGKEVQNEVHQIRNGCDAIITGTGTVLIDNPKLNVRLPRKVSYIDQPIRFISGDREIPKNLNVNDESSSTIFSRRKSPQDYLLELMKVDVRTVLLEAGPKLFSEFMKADMVDELIIYISTKVFGNGVSIVEEMLNAESKRKYELSSVGLVGSDLRIQVSLT